LVPDRSLLEENPMKTLPAVLSCALASFSAAQGRVWVVDRLGGGQFTEIQPAIDVASPGDRVDVRGSHIYAAFTVTKGIDLDATGGAHVRGCTVENLPASERVTVWGFAVDGLLTVRRCTGPLLLAALRVVSPNGQSTPAVTVLDSGQVVLVGCTVLCGVAAAAGRGGDGLQVIRSSVVCERCDVRAGQGGGFSYTPVSGGNGLFVQQGRLFAAATSFTGGAGSPGFVHDRVCHPGGYGGAGASIEDSVHNLFMAGSRITQGFSGANAGCGTGTNGSGIDLIRSAALMTSDSLVVGPASPMPRIPVLAAVTSPDVVVRGSPLTLTFSGAPGTTLLPLVDGSLGLLPVAGLFVPLLVTPAAAPLLPMVVGTTGSIPLTIQIPADPALQDQIFLFQALAFDAGRLTLTNPESVRIR
jgi:hypothetical protein